MTGAEEQTLFVQAKQGNRVAFDRLQKALSGPIRRFIRRLIGRHVGEDDIVSDTLLALYQNLRRIDPPENLRPFLFRIVRNLCYTELRRQGRYQTIMVDRSEDQEDLLASLPDGQATPEGELQRLLLQAELQQARDELPELQRQTLILYCEEDLSYAQISEVMATDIGTVKSRLFYARKFLVKRLSPETLTALGIQL